MLANWYCMQWFPECGRRGNFGTPLLIVRWASVHPRVCKQNYKRVLLYTKPDNTFLAPSTCSRRLSKLPSFGRFHNKGAFHLFVSIVSSSYCVSCFDSNKSSHPVWPACARLHICSSFFSCLLFSLSTYQRNIPYWTKSMRMAAKSGGGGGGSFGTGFVDFVALAHIAFLAPVLCPPRECLTIADDYDAIIEPSSPRCVLCPSGTYNPYRGAKRYRLCNPCPMGMTSGEEARRCRKCAPGKSSASGSSRCVLCSKGSFLTDPCAKGRAPDTACTKCPLGTYASENNSASCAKCPDGMSTAKRGATSKDVCKTCGTKGVRCSCLGDRAPSVAVSSYRPIGQFVCLPCPLGTRTLTPFATSETECIPCPEGTFFFKTQKGARNVVPVKIVLVKEQVFTVRTETIDVRSTHLKTSLESASCVMRDTKERDWNVCAVHQVPWVKGILTRRVIDVFPPKLHHPTMAIVLVVGTISTILVEQTNVFPVRMDSRWKGSFIQKLSVSRTVRTFQVKPVANHVRKTLKEIERQENVENMKKDFDHWLGKNSAGTPEQVARRVMSLQCLALVSDTRWVAVRAVECKESSQ